MLTICMMFSCPFIKECDTCGRCTDNIVASKLRFCVRGELNRKRLWTVLLDLSGYSLYQEYSYTRLDVSDQCMFLLALGSKDDSRFLFMEIRRVIVALV